MAKKKSAPYVPHRLKRYVKVKNKKRKDLYEKKSTIIGGLMRMGKSIMRLQDLKMQQTQMRL